MEQGKILLGFLPQYLDNEENMKIIYETETGICIVHPTGELSIEQVFQKDVPDEYKHTACIVDDSVIPSDRQFRGSWEHKIDNDTHSVIENVDKVKEIHKGRLRTEREEKFKPLDVAFNIALELGIDASDVVKEKNRLRDITKLVDKVETIEDIKKITIDSKVE
jgi:hypothetical protein